jgi:hypothetical protein
MPDPLIGFALQSIAPPVQPYAVSGATALMALRVPSGFQHVWIESRLPKRRAKKLTCDWKSSEHPLTFRAFLRTRVRHFSPAG